MVPHGLPQCCFARVNKPESISRTNAFRSEGVGLKSAHLESVSATYAFRSRTDAQSCSVVVVTVSPPRATLSQIVGTPERIAKADKDPIWIFVSVMLPEVVATRHNLSRWYSASCVQFRLELELSYVGLPEA